MTTDIRNILNLLEDEDKPLTKADAEKLLKDNGNEHLKVSGNKITVLTQLPDGEKSGVFRKATLDEILQTLIREIPEQEPSFSSATNLSSIGGIVFKNSKVHIVVKDIGKQGNKSAGLANEVEIAGMIESVIQKYGTADITFTDDRGVELEIKNDALIEIAKLAVLRKTGARGLRSIMEDLLVDLMYEAPDQKDLIKIIINKEIVTREKKPILVFSTKVNSKIAVNKT